MSLIVTGYVDGEPIYFEEPEPTQYEADAEVEEKPQYEVGITATDEFDNSTTVNQMFYMSGEWIEPVVDRILQDLKEMNSRAYLNYWDLNRIEHDTEYLADILNGYGYNQSLAHKTDWLMSDFPYSAEMERVRSNIQTLIDGYHAQEVELPETLGYDPTTKKHLDWQKLNAVEQNLKLMKEMIGRMEQSFRYCGTFYSGQEVLF